MKLEGGCLTTAMGILPHTDPEKAIELALTLDITFWPQLPRLSFYEDMYVQISEHFPGIQLDMEKREISFSLEKFYAEVEDFLAHWEDESYFRLSPRYSMVFHRFLEKDLSSYRYIRGQSIGPVSLGLKILDEKKKSMIYHQEVREIIFHFVAKKLEAQYKKMKEKNRGAFVWVDEPGLEMIFMAYTGYTSDKALEDYRLFLEKFPGPKGVLNLIKGGPGHEGCGFRRSGGYGVGSGAGPGAEYQCGPGDHCRPQYGGSGEVGRLPG